jgi:hypothetical protein
MDKVHKQQDATQLCPRQALAGMSSMTGCHESWECAHDACMPPVNCQPCLHAPLATE